MATGWLLERMRGWPDERAMVWREGETTYGELVELVSVWDARLDTLGVAPGEVVVLEGDFSPNAVALLLALAGRRAVLVPLTHGAAAQREQFIALAEARRVITVDAADGWRAELVSEGARHPMLRALAATGAPGLILFSSGSTGASKAALHDFGKLLEKFTVPRQRLTTLTFLLLDHIGGINTLLYTLSNGGTVVATARRDPEEVCRLVERYRVQLLPTSPTFLNLLLIAESYRRYDLSSLELVTYGTELMPANTLARIREALPHARLQQTYGLSEVGILRSRSRGSESLWVKLGGEGFETRVVDGTLWVRARSAMVGYLNAPSPFDAEGWMNTQDLVEVDGEYVRFLGRRTEIINVGGQKVSPADVESVLLQIPNVRDATVYGERNPITGQMVVARVNLAEPEEPIALKRRVRAFCRDKLAPHQIPVRVDAVGDELFGPRYKKIRNVEPLAATAQGSAFGTRHSAFGTDSH